MPMADQGVFMMGMQTRPEQAEEALRVSIKTLKEFVRQGPTTEELINAQKNLVGSFPLRIDSNRKIHEYLSVIGFYQLPLNYLELFVGKVENVSAKQIQEAFSRHIDPEQLMMVVVGVQAQSVKP
jgi:zinc protease